MELYKSSRTLSKDDYKLLLNEGKGKERILEFGPGYSTYAWIEAGAKLIISLECHRPWREEKKEQFKRYPQVHVARFDNIAPVAEVADICHTHGPYDLALVDSPRGMASRERLEGQEECSRLNTCLAALEHAPVVLLHDAVRPCERNTLNWLAQLGHTIKFLAEPPEWGTHNYSYGLARITRNGKDERRPDLPGVEMLGSATAG